MSFLVTELLHTESGQTMRVDIRGGYVTYYVPVPVKEPEFIQQRNLGSGEAVDRFVGFRTSFTTVPHTVKLCTDASPTIADIIKGAEEAYSVKAGVFDEA